MWRPVPTFPAPASPNSVDLMAVSARLGLANTWTAGYATLVGQLLDAGRVAESGRLSRQPFHQTLRTIEKGGSARNARSTDDVDWTNMHVTSDL